MRKWDNERIFWMSLSIRFSFLLGGPPWQSNFTRSSRSWLSEVRIMSPLFLRSANLIIKTGSLHAPAYPRYGGQRWEEVKTSKACCRYFFLSFFWLIYLCSNFDMFLDYFYICWLYPSNYPIIRVLDCIECSGPRTFLRDGFPCVRYTNHYFLTGVTNPPR